MTIVHSNFAISRFFILEQDGIDEATSNLISNIVFYSGSLCNLREKKIHDSRKRHVETTLVEITRT